MSSNTTVRTAEISDAAAIQAIYAPMVERTAISFELEPLQSKRWPSGLSRLCRLTPTS